MIVVFLYKFCQSLNRSTSRKARITFFPRLSTLFILFFICRRKMQHPTKTYHTNTRCTNSYLQTRWPKLVGATVREWVANQMKNVRCNAMHGHRTSSAQSNPKSMTSKLASCNLVINRNSNGKLLEHCTP